MNISDFFNNAAAQFRDRYLQMAAERAPKYAPVTTTPTPQPTKSDSFVPTQPVDNTAPTKDGTESSKPNVKPDGTYEFTREAKLNYSMDLRFDMAAISQVARSLSEGDVETLDQFAAAGFGLKAALDIKGSQVIQESGEGVEGDAGKSAQKDTAGARQASKFAYQDRDFQMESFYKESTDVSRSLKVDSRENYRRAVNKFAMRFRLDSGFSMAFAQRFNVQTKQVAESTPESLNNYLDTSGNLAEKGTTEMMATFFNTVDQYLNEAHDQLISVATESFDTAAAELGFSGEMVDAARDTFVGTIDSFFQRVDNAIAGLEARFLPTDVPDSGTPEPASV